MSIADSKLYIVATPIGNLADFSFRAVEVLKRVDLIAAEDTRHARLLLQHYGIDTRLVSLHEHNETRVAPQLIKQIQEGLSIALISDAGTPLLSDPGMPLVRLAKQAGIVVSPVPGACAVIAALSVSGLPVNRFTFEGFAPRTAAARKSWFQGKLNDSASWVFYESSHRILASMIDLAAVLPADRQVCIARELTKLYETIVKTTIQELVPLLQADNNMRRGEFVVIVEGARAVEADEEVDEQLRVLKILLQQCSLKTAVALAVEITGARKKHLYQMALDLTQN